MAIWLGKTTTCGLKRPKRLGQNLGRRLHAVAASQGQEIGAHQLGEMVGIVVHLGDDEIAMGKQGTLKRR